MGRKTVFGRTAAVLMGWLAVWGALCGGVSADRGAMSFFPGIDIYEPAQKAIIAWNGSEELLLLSTDLKAAKPTKVLEVLPLPAQPVISRGDTKVFGQFNVLIRRGLRSQYLSRGPAATGVDAAEITFHEKIGAHDITVVHVLDSGYFEDWVGLYFRGQGLTGYKVSPVMLATIEQYILDGYQWFAFDAVELGMTLQSNDVIEYRFVSDKLYYPLRISGNAKGDTEISLTVVSRDGVTTFLGLPRNKFRPAHPLVEVETAAVAAIHPAMGKMFSPAERVAIQTLRLQGDLAGFDLDVLAR
jgi:hypothetical protein